MTDAEKPRPGLLGSVLRGGLGFAAVSVAAFSIWAFGGGWFRGRGGDPAMYTAIAIAFLGGTGLFLHPLLGGPRRLVRFYLTFIPAYAAYAAAWCGAWFTLKAGFGEWLGSFAGCALFALVTVLRHGRMQSLAMIGLVLFLTHSAGYFLGGELFTWMNDRPEAHFSTLGKLAWGLFYGLGMGAGIGYAFFAARKDAA